MLRSPQNRQPSPAVQPARQARRFPGPQETREQRPDEGRGTLQPGPAAPGGPFESRRGHDFSRVRVSAGTEAVVAARATPLGSSPGAVPAIVHDASRVAAEPTSNEVEGTEAERIGGVGDSSDESAGKPGEGRRLPAELRARLEATAGRDLRGVRIHDDPAAGQAAQALGARAFTLKRDIYFAPGAYDPSSAVGRRLIAHEAAHTLQPEGSMEAGVTAPGDPVEREAEAFADAVMGRPLQPQAGPVMQAATAAASSARALVATRTRVPRFPGVVESALDEDKLRLIDPADPGQGKVWQPDRGYIKNPTATKLSTVATPQGKIGGGFDNGNYMYVIDDKGEVWVGKRLRKNMPHPTLIGGKDPQVLGAGMVEIRGGKIVRIDNHSGHFRPPRASLRDAVKGFLKLPREVFKNFRAESVHFDPAGTETRKAFRSLRMLKLKRFSPTKTINRLRLRYKYDPKFRGRIKSGLKGAGKAGLAIIVVLILDYFLGKWMAELEAEQIRKSLARLEPEVEAALLKSLEAQADTLDALHESDPDAKVYINIVYRLAWLESFVGSGPMGEPMSSEDFVGAELVSAEFSQTAVKEDIRFESFDACIGSTTTYKRLSMSEEILVGDLYGDEPGERVEPEQAAGGGE